MPCPAEGAEPRGGLNTRRDEALKEAPQQPDAEGKPPQAGKSKGSKKVESKKAPSVSSQEDIRALRIAKVVQGDLPETCVGAHGVQVEKNLSGIRHGHYPWSAVDLIPLVPTWG